MKIHSLQLLFLCLLGLFSCGRTPETKKKFLEDPNLSLSQKLELYLESDTLLNKCFTQSEIKVLREFYKHNHFNAVIFQRDSTATSQGKTVLQLVNHALAFGVPSEFIGTLNSRMHPVEKELFTIINLSRLISVRKHGFTDSIRAITKIDLSDVYADLNLLSKGSYDQSRRRLLSIGPVQDTLFDQLSKNIYDYATRYKLDTIDYDIKNFKTAPERNSLVAKSLFAKGYLKDSMPREALQTAALFAFKRHNGLDSSAEVTDYTVEALCESNKTKLTRAAISLESVRKHKYNNKKFVVINLPEYHLYFYANDSLKAKHRIVIGKRSNETPELESEIRSIVLFPYWRVPASIVKKEIMPEVRKNKNYLARHHYTLRGYKDTAALDVNKINLKSNGYSIVQSPGRWNSLGVIKFEFNNAHSVYVHDTPQKGLFNRSVRSFSHGCMRCEFPVDLGQKIINYDQKEGKIRKTKPHDLDSLLKLEEHRVISLNDKIPISVVYRTVTLQQVNLVFHIDIYHRDAQFIKQLKKCASEYNFHL